MLQEYSINKLSQELGFEIKKIIPIGNHDLKRNHVYLIETIDEKMVLKLYFKDNRRCREIASLEILKYLGVKVPKMIKYGELSDGTKWSIKNLIPGDTLIKKLREIPEKDMLSIMYDLGQDLGKIHTSSSFDFYGNWDEFGNSIENFKTYKDRHLSIVTCIKEDIKSKNMPDKALILEGIDKLYSRGDLLREVKSSRLTHNDFNYRNILVEKSIGTWKYSGLIDFEQCLPDFKDRDLVVFDYMYLNRHMLYKETFYDAYSKYCKKSKIYNDFYKYHLIYLGVYICSWSYEVAKDYYEKGRDLIEMELENF